MKMMAKGGMQKMHARNEGFPAAGALAAGDGGGICELTARSASGPASAPARIAPMRRACRSGPISSYNQKLSIAIARQENPTMVVISISPRRRQEASVLQCRRCRFAQPSRRPFHRARGVLQPDRAAKGEEGLRLAVDRITFWQDRGARMSDTVAGLVKRSAKPQRRRRAALLLRSSLRSTCSAAA